MIFLKLFTKEIKPHKDAWVVIFFVLLFIFLRLPSLVEPYWYGDEGIYQVIGKALNSGRILYQDIWDNKPPLLYFIYALFNGDQFLVRMFSLIIGTFSVVAFYFLGKEFFKKRKSVLLSTLIYTLFLGSPLVEGNIANAENFMHLPIILAAIFVLRYPKSLNPKWIFLSGVLLSIAFMTKIVAVFEFIAFFIFLFVSNHDIKAINKIKEILSFKKLKPEILFTAGFISLLFVFTIYFISISAFPEFLSGVLSENIDYVGSENNFIFPMGILLLKAIIVFILLGFILISRKKFSNQNLFIYLWLTTAMFSTFFSQRPYMHYILMSALPFSYFIGSIIEEKRHRLVKIIVGAILIIIVYFNFGIYKNTFSYYKNYIQFVFYEKKIDDYQAFFDKNTPRDYELARFIKMFSKDSSSDVFVWSDSGQIYALSDTLPPGKYIVAYHITYYNDAVSYMIEQIEKTKPTYIIKTKDSPEFNKFLSSYVLKYKVVGSDIYERQN